MHVRAAEFLYETSLFPDLEYTFKSAPTHDVAYGSLLQERRRAIHARIVKAIEQLYPDRLTEHVAEIFSRVAEVLQGDRRYEWTAGTNNLGSVGVLAPPKPLSIIPAGNWVLDPQAINQALNTGVWDAARVDASVCGGITAARKVMTIAEAAGCRCELQCWGYTLSQAANLQTMLGLPNCSFFEQPVPYDAFEYAMYDVIRPRADGYVYAADAAGLGVRVDWDSIRSATLSRIEFREKSE